MSPLWYVGQMVNKSSRGRQLSRPIFCEVSSIKDTHFGKRIFLHAKDHTHASSLSINILSPCQWEYWWLNRRKSNIKTFEKHPYNFETRSFPCETLFLNKNFFFCQECICHKIYQWTFFLKTMEKELITTVLDQTKDEYDKKHRFDLSLHRTHYGSSSKIYRICWIL